MTSHTRPEAISALSGSRRGLAVLLAVFLAFTLLQALWLSEDRRPVVEERHYFAAAHMAHQFLDSAVGREYPDYGNVSPYPPLVVYMTAPFLAAAGISADMAVLSLLPFAWLLLWSVWRCGRILYSGTAALTAALLALAFHHFIVVEEQYPPFSLLKEYLLDLPLSAMTALSLYLLLAHFTGDRSRHRLILAPVLGLGALTKITFPAYFVIVAASLYLGGYRDPRRWRKLALPVLAGAVIALPWYLLNFGDLAATFVDHEISSEWARQCGKPEILSAAGLLYYPRLIPAMVSPPFAAFLAAAVLILAVTRFPGWRLLVSGLLLPYIALSMIYGKDARLIAPFMVYAALAGAAVVDLVRHSGVRTAAVTALWCGAVLRILFMNGLPSGSLEGIPSPPPTVMPASHDWAVRSIMKAIEAERDPSLLLRVAVIPFLGHFKHSSFMQYALEHDLPLARDTEWKLRCELWEEELASSEFIVTKDGYGGPEPFVPNRENARHWIRARLGKTVFLLGEFPLPDGSLASLYRQDRLHPAWEVLPSGRTGRPVARFGDIIELSSYNIASQEGKLLVKCQWRALSKPAREYKFFLQVRRGFDNVAAESFVPGGGLLPITLWERGFRLAETYSVPLPSRQDGGEYEVWAGWHRRRRRLKVRDADVETSLRAVRLGVLGTPAKPAEDFSEETR